MSVKESTIPGAGNGIFVREDVPAKTILSEYGGELLTLAEARKRQMQVISFCVFLHIPTMLYLSLHVFCVRTYLCGILGVLNVVSVSL